MNLRKLISTLWTTIIVLAPLTPVSAQSKIALDSRLSLMREQQSQPRALRMPGVAVAEGSSHKVVMIDMNTPEGAAQLEAAGVEVLRVRGNIAICSVLTDSLEAVSELDCVKKIEFGRSRFQKMNLARQETGIDKIHQGIELPQAYTGRGVVTGICDSGFDPNHVNFRDENGQTRFGYMSRIYTSQSSAKGYIYENYYPANDFPIYDAEGNERAMCYPIEEFHTDTYENYHGTHTLGSMAGSYKGNITVGVAGGGLSASEGQTINNPYYGGATQSEIVASCGDLLDEYIAMGIEDIVNYAALSNGVDEEGRGVAPKPCVINLSLGSTLGSHDPNSVMNKFLSLIGQEVIVCVAAGNEGELPIALQKSFTAEDAELKSFVVSQPAYSGAYTEDGTNYFYNLRSGSIYIYGDDATPLDVQAVIYNKSRQNIAMRMAVGGDTSDAVLSWASSESYNVYGNATTNNATFNKAFDGYVAVAGTVDSETGRYQAIVNFFLTDNQSTNANSNYVFGLVVKGSNGQRTHVFCDGLFTQFDGGGVTGWSDGSHDGTISDMACANNILTVGSYNTRSRWASIDGQEHGYDEGVLPIGDASYFSSYATLDDGSTLPHICAPGACIISSVNTYCVENLTMNYQEGAIQGIYPTAMRNYYWHQSMGTSMSTPVVAGAIALWLEADPSLTIADVKDIVRTTAVVDEHVTNGVAAQWGAGKFDAYAGLKEVIRRRDQGVESLTGQRLSPSGAAIYNLAGQPVRRIDCAEGETFVSTEGIAPGIYTLVVDGNQPKKIIIR